MEANTVALLTFSLFLFVSWLPLMEVEGAETARLKQLLERYAELYHKNEVYQTKKRVWLDSQKWEFMVTYIMSLRYLKQLNIMIKQLSPSVEKLNVVKLSPMNEDAESNAAVELNVEKYVEKLNVDADKYVDKLNVDVDEYVEKKLEERYEGTAEERYEGSSAIKVEMTRLMKEQDKRLILAFFTLETLARVMVRVMDDADSSADSTDSTDADADVLMNNAMDSLERALDALANALDVIERFSTPAALESLKADSAFFDSLIASARTSSDEEERELVATFSSGRQGPQSNGNGKAVATALLALSFTLVFLTNVAFYLRRRRQKTVLRNEK